MKCTVQLAPSVLLPNDRLNLREFSVLSYVSPFLWHYLPFLGSLRRILMRLNCFSISCKDFNPKSYVGCHSTEGGMGSCRDVLLLKRSRRQPPHLPLHPREGLSLCFQCRPRDYSLVFLQLHSGDRKNQSHKWLPPPPCNSTHCKESWGAGSCLTRVCTQHRGLAGAKWAVHQPPILCPWPFTSHLHTFVFCFIIQIIFSSTLYLKLIYLLLLNHFKGTSEDIRDSLKHHEENGMLQEQLGRAYCICWQQGAQRVPWYTDPWCGTIMEKDARITLYGHQTAWR